MIRELQVQGIDELTLDISEYISEDYQLIPERSKIKDMLMTCTSSNMHVAFVDKEGPNINGYLVIGAGQLDFAKRSVAQIVFFKFKKSSKGRELISSAIDWIRKRKSISIAHYGVPFTTTGIDLFEEAGFKNSGSMIYWRRAWDFSQKSGKV